MALNVDDLVACSCPLFWVLIPLMVDGCVALTNAALLQIGDIALLKQEAFESSCMGAGEKASVEGLQ